MYMQLITNFLALIAAAAGVFATVGAGLWLLIGLRVAPVQQDVSELKVAVSDLDGKVSDLKAQFAELNGKFDMIMTLFKGQVEVNLPKTDSSEDPTSGSSAPAE